MDSTAFRELALQEMDAVYRMAMTLARDPNEASDLVQETYLKAFKAEGRFELREAGVKPWLFKILHNNFYTRYQKKKRESPTDSEVLHDALPGVSDEPPPAWDLEHLDWEQVDDRLKHAINDLPEHYREVLLLWAVEGLKYREIADVLGVALGTVMSRLYRARQTLSGQLAELAAEHGITVDASDR
ncbi:MAG: sigma-70 family RNA polymerase sigma factor [Planctomycetota bacterium]